MKSLKEKWERSVQSTRENGENEIGLSSIVTVLQFAGQIHKTPCFTFKFGCRSASQKIRTCFHAPGVVGSELRKSSLGWILCISVTLGSTSSSTDALPLAEALPRWHLKIIYMASFLCQVSYHESLAVPKLHWHTCKCERCSLLLTLGNCLEIGLLHLSQFIPQARFLTVPEYLSLNVSAWGDTCKTLWLLYT